jgi:hypothetical protein
MELVWLWMFGRSPPFEDGKAVLRRGSRSPGVVGVVMLVRLLLAESGKPLLRMLKLPLVRTAGSMVWGDSSSGMVVAWMGKLY